MSGAVPLFSNSYGMKINPAKSKAIDLGALGLKSTELLSLGDQKVPETSSFKYLEIILRSDLNLVDQVN